jgi:hypothetical protein
MGEERKLYKVLVGKLEGGRPLGRSWGAWFGGLWIGFDWLRIGAARGLL